MANRLRICPFLAAIVVSNAANPADERVMTVSPSDERAVNMVGTIFGLLKFPVAFPSKMDDKLFEELKEERDESASNMS